MNYYLFEQIIENIGNYRDIKIVTTNKQRKKLVSEPNYHTRKHILENFLKIKMKKKTEMKMNKLKYIGLSILNIAKRLMYEFWYYYIKPKDGDRTKLCYTDTDSLIIYNKTENF